MPHPAVYAFSIAAGIGVAIGILIASYLVNRNANEQHESRNHYYRRGSRSQLDGFEYIDYGSKCTICLDDVDLSQIEYLRCGHLFHKECIQRWQETSDTCPNCLKHV